MAQKILEKMTYRFDVISDYDGNTYILDKVQKALTEAEINVKDGLNDAPHQAELIQGHWNVKRRDVYIDID